MSLASEPSRLALGASTVRTRSASGRTSSGFTSRSQPGSVRRDSGRPDGPAKLTCTSTPARSRTSANASPAPMVSASGWMWHRMLTERAAARTFAAPRASTRSPTLASSVVSIAVTATLPVRRVIPVLSYHTVRLCVARRFGALPDSCQICIRLARAFQQLLHPVRHVWHGVAHERQRRGEPHAGAGADLGSQHPFGLLQRGGSPGIIRVVVELAGHYRVVHRHVVQVRGDLRVGDRHPGKPWIFDLVLDRRCDDGGDPLG